MMTGKKNVPVTVISGYLGAGKTTLVNQLLSESAGKMGVLVNDFGALNIDADLIVNRDGVTMELTNGCLCCQITDDLGDALTDLSKTDVEEVLIEASGVAKPEAIAEYVQSWPGYKLAGVFNLVDVSRIEQLLENRFARRLILNQINQSDVLLLSKTDLIEPGMERVVSEKLKSAFGKPLYALNGGAAGWILNQAREDQSDPASTGEPAENGTDAEAPHVEYKSTLYQPGQSLSREKLDEFLNLHRGIVRAKGWFIDNEDQCWLLQSVGDRRNYEKQFKQETPRLVFIYPEEEEISFELLLVPG